MKVTWIIFFGTYFAFGIFLSETSATYPFSIIHTPGIPGFSVELASLSTWILTTFTVTHLMTSSTFAASISHLNATHRSPKGLFGGKTRLDDDDDDDDDDSKKKSSNTIKDRARLLLGTLNRNNCFAKVICGLGTQPPSTKTDLLNDYVYLMNDLLSDDESDKPNAKTKKRPNRPYTRDDIKNGGGEYYPGGRPFEHEMDEDGEMDEFDKEFDYATLGELADEELVDEEGPGVMSYIMKEAKNRMPGLKLRVGRSIKDDIIRSVTPTPKITSGEMDSEEANNYFLMKKMELNKTQEHDIEKTLFIASEAGSKLRNSRQCRLLFDQCPFGTEQITEILGNLRKILQGQPVSQPTPAFFPAFSAQPGVLARPVQTAQTVNGGGGGSGNNNVDKVEIVVHLNGATNNGGNKAYTTQTNSNYAPPAPQQAPQMPYAPAVPFSPPFAAPVAPQQPVQAGSLNPVSEVQPEIPIPTDPADVPHGESNQSTTMVHPQITPQTNPQATHLPTAQSAQQYPQAVYQQAQIPIAPLAYPQAVPQTVPQYQYPQQMTPEMIMQMYPQIAGNQPVTQDKIIDFLQGILEHNPNENQTPLVPKNSKPNTILIDGKEVPTTDYLKNLKKTLQTLAQMNKLALATEAQIVAKDAANGELSEEEDSPEDDDSGTGAFPDLLSDGPDLASLTQTESSEEDDKVVKLKPQKGIHHNQRPTGLRPGTTVKKPWGLAASQQDDPFEDDKAKKRKEGSQLNNAQFIDAFIKAGISHPKPKEEVQPTRKKKKKKNRRKKKPKPVSKETDSKDYEENQQDDGSDPDDKQQDDISNEDSEEQQDEESSEDDEGDLEKPPKNGKIKFSLKATLNNVSATVDPYLPSPEEKEKLNILSDILLPGAYNRPVKNKNKGNRHKGSSSSKRPVQPIKMPVSSNFDQEFEKISSDIGGNGTEILDIDEFSETSDKVPKFKKSKRKPTEKPNVDSEEEDEEEDEENDDTDQEYEEEGDPKGRRVRNRKPSRQRVALVALPYQDEPEEDDGKLPTEAPSSSLQTNIMSYLVGLTGVKPVNPLPAEDPGSHPFEHYLTYKAPYQPDEKPSKHPFAFYNPGYPTPAPTVFSKTSQFRDEEESSEEDDKKDKDKKDKKKDDDKKDKKKKKKKDKDDSDENHGHSTQFHFNNHQPQHEGEGEIDHNDPSKTKGIYLSMTMHDDGFPLTPDAYELALPVPNINDDFVSLPAPEDHHGYGHLHHPGHPEINIPQAPHHHPHPHHHHMEHHHHPPHHHDSDEDDDSDEKKDKKKDKKKDNKKKKKDKDKDEDGDHGWESDDDDGKDKDKKKKKKKDKGKDKDDDDNEEWEEDDLANVPPEQEPIHQALRKVIPGFGKPSPTQSQFSAENHSRPPPGHFLNGPLILEPEDDEDDDTNSGENSAEKAPVRKTSNQNSNKGDSSASSNTTTSASNPPTAKPKRVMKYKGVRRTSPTTFRPRLRNTTVKPSGESEEESSDSNSSSSKKSQRRKPERKNNNFRSGIPMQEHDNQPSQSAEIHFNPEDDGRSGLKSGTNNRGGYFGHHYGSASDEGHHSGNPSGGIPSLVLPDTGDPHEISGPDGSRYPVYHDSHPLTVLPLPDLNQLFSGLTNMNFGHFHG